MKNLTYIFAIFGLFALSSCGTNEASESENIDTEDATKAEAENSEGMSTSSNCDDFLDKYEAWMNDYVVLMKKMEANPMDMSVLTEYTKVATEGMKWMQEWGTLVKCASMEKYQKRFDEIAAKADAEMAE